MDITSFPLMLRVLLNRVLRPFCEKRVSNDWGVSRVPSSQFSL